MRAAAAGLDDNPTTTLSPVALTTVFRPPNNARGAGQRAVRTLIPPSHGAGDARARYAGNGKGVWTGGRASRRGQNGATGEKTAQGEARVGTPRDGVEGNEGESCATGRRAAQRWEWTVEVELGARG